MCGEFVRNQVGIYLSLLLTVGFQELVRIPNDRGGVGANGAIGRGTSEGEQFVSVGAPPSTTWVYAAPPVSVQPEAVSIRPAFAGNADRGGAAVAETNVTLPAVARRNPYQALHRGWVYGYWETAVPASRARSPRGPAVASAGDGQRRLLGVGLGWGLPGWLVGPMAYSWGYVPYENPYDRPGSRTDPAGPRFDDYSRPIDLEVPPPTEALLDEALVGFRAARDAFRRADYTRALRQADDALRLSPNDPMLHEFRALSLFALGRYDDSAAVLHALLAVVPGWDWPTMISLYGDPGAYTGQLRRLEEYIAGRPGSAAARFVLAYHYMTTGYVDDAADGWRRAAELAPLDGVSLRLIRALRPGYSNTADSPPRPPVAPSAALSPDRQPTALVGTWLARPRPETIVTLMFGQKGRIVWKVNQRGRNREFDGSAVYEQNILALFQDPDNALVGAVRWWDADHFTFTALAGWPGDAGMTFARSEAMAGPSVRGDANDFPEVVASERARGLP